MAYANRRAAFSERLGKFCNWLYKITGINLFHRWEMMCLNKQFGSASRKDYFTADASGILRNPLVVVFPLAKSVNNCPEIIGTGFFVTKFGVFITAKHVLEEVLDSDMQPTAQLFALQCVQDGIIRRRVIGGSINNESDIGIGICQNLDNSDGEPLTSPILPMTTRIPQLGESVVTYACPDVTVRKCGKRTDIRANYYSGEIEEYYPDGRDIINLPFPCYRTSIAIHGGASGGPVFDQNGNVFGVNCCSFDGMPDVSFVTRIVEGLGLNVTADHIVFPDPSRTTLADLARYKMATIIDDDSD